MIAERARPLKAVEIDFAVDSSGFTTCTYESWFDHKYGAPRRRQHSWVKVHLMCGVKTDVVTAVEILDKHAYDGRQFPALVQARPPPAISPSRRYPPTRPTAAPAMPTPSSRVGVRRSSP
jgi:hypothetical protein